MSERKHNHYFKDVSHLKEIDVYRVLQLFGVTDPCIQHAVKKLLVAGGRGAGKDIERDLREAVDSVNRALQMIAEDDVRSPPQAAQPGTDTHIELHGEMCKLGDNVFFKIAGDYFDYVGTLLAISIDRKHLTLRTSVGHRHTVPVHMVSLRREVE